MRLNRDVGVISTSNNYKITILDNQITHLHCKLNKNANAASLLEQKVKAKECKHISYYKEYQLNFAVCAATVNLILD